MNEVTNWENKNKNKKNENSADRNCNTNFHDMMKTGFYFIYFSFCSFLSVTSFPVTPVETIPVNSYMELNNSIIFQTISAPKCSNFRFLFFLFFCSQS
jgi:hypothetical protein